MDVQEQRGVCRNVTKPTPGVSSLVITQKINGTLRVCSDPRDLNKEFLIIIAAATKEEHDHLLRHDREEREVD